MLPQDSNSSSTRARKQVGSFVLEGRTILCECPSCRGPMSVRLWLLEAECWQCGTRIEISESERSELEKALQEIVQPATPRIDPPQETVLKPKVEPKPKPKPIPPQPVPAKPKPIAAPPVANVPGIDAPPVQLRNSTKPLRIIARYFELAPAWLISLLIHIFLLLLLAFLTIDSESYQGIILSLTVSSQRQEGDRQSWVAVAPRAYDLPLPKHLNANDPNDQGVIEDSKKLAKQLGEVNYEKGFQPNAIETVRSQINQPYETSHGMVARDIRVRNEVLTKQGGTLLTEAAVARALRWIADQQTRNGSWKLDSLNYDPGRGVVSSDQGGTALALLPFLGAGQTHKAGLYRKEVDAGLKYLLKNQRPDGDLRGGTMGEAGMYVHGQAAIVLCEAYAMTKDPKLAIPVKKAIQFIVEAQHSQGGWRYRPGDPGDTSVLGWQLMALQSARMAGLEVPNRSLQLADNYLDGVSVSRGARFKYQERERSHSPNMSAEGLLCRLYLGAEPDSAPIKNGLRYLLRDHPPSYDYIDFYYWYYATQAFHHVGGEPWQEWNESMRDVLVRLQVNQGKHAGSWNVQGYLAEQGGRLYVTSLATCTLEVYYRHLPLFESSSENTSK